MWFFPGKKKKVERAPNEGPILYGNRYADTPIEPDDYPRCRCFEAFYAWEDRFEGVESDEEYDRLENLPLVWSESVLHVDEPSHSRRAWDIACEIMETSARKGVKELNLGKIMDRKDYKALNTLPETIGKLKDLRKLVLYGSNLSSIPREISGCVNLRSFEPYTSYRLHWLPYEITRCRKLTDSCVSTRALYGNHKMRSPFPDLTAHRWSWPTGRSYCSVCGTVTDRLEQYWISRIVATDVVPLLVSVCSQACRMNIGTGARNYHPQPHQGGLKLRQPHADDV